MQRGKRDRTNSSQSRTTAGPAESFTRHYGRGIIIALVAVGAVSLVTSLALFNPTSLSTAGSPASTDLGGPEWKRLKNCRTVPEYNRRMKRLVISLAHRDTSLRLQHEILRRLPEYTEIIILLPKANVGLIRNDLKDKPYRRAVRLVAHESPIQKQGRFYLLFPEKDKFVQIDTPDHSMTAQQGTLWAQDLFKPVVDHQGHIVLLTSEIHKWYCSIGDETDFQVIRDNVYLEVLSSDDVQVRTLPLVFMGGNILVDRIGDRTVAFCGGDVLRTTRTAREAVFDQKESDTRIIDIIADVFNADTVVVLGTDRVQPSTMYHLDQAMILLSDQTVGVARIVGPEPTEPVEKDQARQVEQYLAELRASLSNLGYKLIDIDITVRNLLQCQHYVNAIAYIHAETAQKTLLMPVFPSGQTELDKQLVRKNTASFEALGYKVVHIPTKADELRGGIHCLVNVLE